MKKALKLIGKIFLGFLILLTVFLIIMAIYNQIMLEKNKALYETPLGQMVEVDGHDMCVYAAGKGEHTLVFLSGSGTAAPILDFRSLYSLLEEDYRIVVIEKFGYGFSDVVDEERSFDTILRQDREALDRLGIDGPFILCPHSMSGLEAILWAQEYPGEVEAIVGLDMSLPRHYDGYDFKSTLRFERLAAVARKMGIIRFYYTDSSLPQALSEEEKAIYKAIAARKAVNIDIMYESAAIPDACEKIDGSPKPDIPTLLFVSDGKETGIANWAGIQKDYISSLTNARTIEFDCGHYVHNFKQDEINRQMREFIEGLDE